MPLEAVEPGGRRFLDELFLQLFTREAEGHVHQRAAVLVRRAAIEARSIDLCIQLLGLAHVGLFDGLEAAQLDQPFHDQAERVHREGRRRVVERTVLGVHRVIEHRRQRRLFLGRTGDQIFTDDHHGDARGPHVLLSARVDQCVPGNVDRFAEHVR